MAAPRSQESRRDVFSAPPIESVKDARSAIRWMRANAAALHLDPDRLVVAGQSAGGQLALATALIEINESTDDLAVSPVPNGDHAGSFASEPLATLSVEST